MPYHFSPEIERELREFDTDDVGQVADEIRLTKLLIKRAVEQGNNGLVNAFLSTLAKLSSAQISNQVRVGQLLESSALICVAQQMSEAIAARLECVPNKDSIIDALVSDFSRILSAQRQTPRLTHEPAGDRIQQAVVLPLAKLE